jgi:ParB family transcriptional regulator, chromosome partitioning protein
MAEDTRHRGLGRGLSALLDEEGVESRGTGAGGRNSRTMPVAFLKPNRFQPRRAFGEEELRELADSIGQKGILQPILVRPTGQSEVFEIVAGERRWRAAQLAKIHEVPVIIREFSDGEALEIALIENLQRADLNALEEAGAYQELIARFQHTQEQLSDAIGKSRSHIANTLRLLKLPEPVKAMIREGKLTAGHARTLIGADDPEKLAREILAGRLNVRQAERKVRAPKGKTKQRTKDADTKALETNISNALGMSIEIEHKGERGGMVKIHYKTLEQLDELVRRLSLSSEVD